MIESKKRIFSGVDVKRFQYEEYATNLSDKQINLKDLISKFLFKKPVDMNCVMINLEKDTNRYDKTLDEFKKVSIANFSHLKATYWKEREIFENDITSVIDFLKQFNPNIKSNQIKFDEFSTPNDPNIHIQDGPLACYTSHLRSMIWGWNNFQDYTIIVEDDISITNTEYIEKYIQEIPDDWDIILFNACSKNKIYDGQFYKFEDEFHSTHFYIINHKCFPFLFQNLYPITDQVDVLISDLHNRLNIYNIEETVFQRNISTNTQNNLYVIFNSPHYKSIRNSINIVKNSLIFIINKMLPNNKNRNKSIVLDLIYDILWEWVLHFNPDKGVSSHPNREDYDIDLSKYNYSQYDDLVTNMELILQCSKKGIGKSETIGIIKNFLFTIEKFDQHNKIDNEYNEELKAYGFGSTAHTYLLKKSNVIIKKYNNKLRWLSDDHNNSMEIFDKEVSILKKINNPRLLCIDRNNMIIKMEYCGESLYENFSLPTDWKDQITNIFLYFDRNGIFYPEFRLQNILVMNGKITLIDYGLATFNNQNNLTNLNKFISSLSILDSKLSNIMDRNKRLQLITTFMNNV